MEVYTKGRRKTDDIDLFIHKEDIAEAASRFSTKPKRRVEKTPDYTIDEYGFQTKLNRVEIEVTTGFPPKRMKEGTIEKVFDNKKERKYLGETVDVVPIEEVIVHKAKMGRDKDLTYLKIIKSLDIEINGNLLKQIAEYMGVMRNSKIL